MEVVHEDKDEDRWQGVSSSNYEKTVIRTSLWIFNQLILYHYLHRHNLWYARITIMTILRGNSETSIESFAKYKDYPYYLIAWSSA